MSHTLKLLVPQARRILSCRVRHFRTLISPIQNNTLQLRLATALDQKKPIAQVLEHWRELENQMKKHSDHKYIIKNLQDSERFSHALQISEWMMSSNQKVYILFPEDMTSQIQLIDTVLGLKEAEKFFETIPETMKDYIVYTTLLTMYTRSENTLYKAEAVFEKMRDLGFLLKPSPYNLMISLYRSLRNQERVNELLSEMEENNVEPHNYTSNYD